jgi:hypothetical protein
LVEVREQREASKSASYVLGMGTLISCGALFKSQNTLPLSGSAPVFGGKKKLRALIFDPDIVISYQ